jgi:hypothetical protein
MARLHWTETPDGWRSGRFHIEADAVTGWTLSIDDMLPAGPQALDHDDEPSFVIRTQAGAAMPSVEAWKQAAGRLAEEMDRSQRVRVHVIRAIAAGAGFTFAIALSGGWTYPVAFGLAFLALREAVTVVDILTGRARIVARPYQ